MNIAQKSLGFTIVYKGKEVTKIETSINIDEDFSSVPNKYIENILFMYHPEARDLDLMHKRKIDGDTCTVFIEVDFTLESVVNDLNKALEEEIERREEEYNHAPEKEYSLFSYILQIIWMFIYTLVLALIVIKVVMFLFISYNYISVFVIGGIIAFILTAHTVYKHEKNHKGDR